MLGQSSDTAESRRERVESHGWGKGDVSFQSRPNHHHPVHAYMRLQSFSDPSFPPEPSVVHDQRLIFSPFMARPRFLLPLASCLLACGGVRNRAVVRSSWSSPWAWRSLAHASRSAGHS